MSVPFMICLLSAFSVVWIGVIVLFFFRRQASDFRQVMSFLKTTCKNIEQMARMTYLAQKEASSMVLASQLTFLVADLEGRLTRNALATGLFEQPFHLHDFERALQDAEFVRSFYEVLLDQPGLKEAFKNFMAQYDKVLLLVQSHDSTRLFSSYFEHTPVKSIYAILTDMMEGLYMPDVKDYFKGFNPSRVSKSALDQEPSSGGEESEGDVPPIDWGKAKKERLGKYKKS